MKIKIALIALFISLLSLPFLPVNAASEKEKGTVFVSADENITGNLFAAGENIIVDGIVGGDLIAAANYITVTGRIEGDIIAVGQNINIEGEVGGNVRVFGSNININGSISRNLNAFGSQVTIGNETRIGWDAIIGGSATTIRGNIIGALDSYSQKTFIAGKVGKNVKVRVLNNEDDGLIIDKNSVINGNLDYYSKEELNLNANSSISGDITWQNLNINKKSPFLSWLWEAAFSFLSVLFIGLFFIFITPRLSRQFIKEAKNKTGKTLLWGSLFTLIAIPLALILAFTIIGIPLSIILISLWLAGLFVGKTIATLILGDLIFTKILKREKVHLFWVLLIGSFVLSLISLIPWFGWILSFVAIWLGLGSILSYVTNKPKNI